MAIVGLALSLASIWFFLEWDIRAGDLLSDEGFLWYGAWRTALGEVPIRDFQAYDPGRYYWSATWFLLTGHHGPMSLKTATMAFEFLGLLCGLLALVRVFASYLALCLAGVVLLLWMHPWYKSYDHVVSIALVYFGMLLIERPTRARHFVGGLVLGVAAFFGRNHGLYGLIAYLAIIFIVWFKVSRHDLPERLIAWAGGIAVGYSPMVIMALFVPGVFEAFWEDVISVFTYGATNIALPVPWPWRFDYAGMSLVYKMHRAVTGILFLAMPMFFAAAAMYLLRMNGAELQRRALLMACIAVGVPYLHYAFSRADLTHLALGIHPFLLAALALTAPLFASERRRPVGSAVAYFLVAVSLVTVGVVSPVFRKSTEQYVAVAIVGEEKVWADRDTAGLVRILKRIDGEFLQPSELILVAPHWPGSYPILGRRSPLWEIYFLFPRTEADQRHAIQELKRTRTDWVLLGDVPLDRRDDLRFRNTHRLLWEHFEREFEPVALSELPAAYRLMKRKAAPASPDDPSRGQPALLLKKIRLPELGVAMPGVAPQTGEPVPYGTSPR